MANYELSVGMEVHAELLTQSKMFCRCEVAFGGEPNTRVCPVCLGLPGSLPVPNRYAVELVLKTALALNCTIAMDSIFHRKNYFYPDLPKGYQVSQYGDTNPIGYGGYLEIPTADGGIKRIGIRRVHLEEDTGKLIHLPIGGSGVDYNRAGVPLMEIVSEFPPDIHSADEAKEYIQQLRQLLIYLGVCDGKMEQGSMRCEPNISVRLEGAEELGTKTELKNLGSFRSVHLGVEFERKRQIAVLEQGGKVSQETRGWNEATETSFSMRVKEAENDYRYFPDPDLVPMQFTQEYVQSIRESLPELPLAKLKRYQTELGLSAYDAGVLTAEPASATFFEECLKLGAAPKEVCNLMTSDFSKLLNEAGQTLDGSDGTTATKIQPSHIAEFAKMRESGEISSKILKELMDACFQSGESAREAMNRLGLTMVSNQDEIRTWCLSAMTENADAVAKYKAGQTNVIGFLVGQVMRKSQGKANPQLVQAAMKEELEK